MGRGADGAAVVPQPGVAATLELARRPSDHRIDPVALDDIVETRAITVVGNDEDDLPGAIVATDDHGQRWRLTRAPDRPMDGLVRAMPVDVDVPFGVAEFSGARWLASPSRGGTTLAERILAAGRSLTLDELETWMHAIFDLVERCHQQGLVCLRIAPFTVRFDGNRARFDGIGGLFAIGTSVDSLPAVEGYTAPEVLYGDVPDGPDPRADIYGMAMILWCMVAQRDPPVSAMSGYLPVLEARDCAPSAPLGLARFIAFAGAPVPGDRPASIRAARALFDECIGRARRWSGDAPVLSVRASVAAESHIGILKRRMAPINQDKVVALSTPDGDRAVLVVCDGVSTAAWGSGDVAANIALDQFTRAWPDWADGDLPEDPAAWVTGVIERANAAVVQRVNDSFAPFDREPEDAMGTTCVVAWVADGVAWIGSAGDSRAYLVRPRFVERVTRDHNVATMELARGAEPDDILTFAHGAALGRCLGLFDIDSEGMLVPRPVEPDVVRIRLDRGDRLVLCSDGVTDFIGVDNDGPAMALYRIVTNEPLPDLACVHLVYEANRCGGADNIGVAVLAAEADVIDPFSVISARFRDDADVEPLDL